MTATRADIGGTVTPFRAPSDGLPASGLMCLVAIAARHGIRSTPDALAHEHQIAADLTEETVARIAVSIGLKARVAQIEFPDLKALKGTFPLLARLANGNYVVVMNLAEGAEEAVIIWDPLTHASGLLEVKAEQFKRSWNGSVIYLKRAWSWRGETQHFGLQWFIPQLMKERAAFRDVALAAICMQLTALLVPIYFQLMVDKVVTHHSWSTLWVLTGGVIIALIFESTLSFLRQYLLIFATTKIDIRLAVRIFAHVMDLPISYFERASTGVTVRHIQQVDRIRQFLTGRVFLTTLDGVALLVLGPILLMYSLKLTLVILIVTGLIAAVVAALIGPLRSRLKALHLAEGERQAMLVEVVSGVRTVKSMALEPIEKKKWNSLAARVVDLNFNAGKLSAGAQALIHFLERLMIILVIAIGASEVFAGNLSIGALIAIQMLAGRVAAPLVQAASLIHDYQETAISVAMLGEIMNTPAENAAQKNGARPPLHGRLEFDRVGFRYGPNLSPALDRISLSIAPGAIVGIVGRSGSGKTTLTRLIQGFYPCQEGVIRVDGVDIREIDLAYLRRNMGVVLQENFMFRGSVRDNIALGKPEAGIDEVIRAARMAGAAEFIEQLPQTYDTLLEENAVNLSGGQRQRLAIARALIMEPRFLIFDEATSALDPETEGLFLDHLPQMAARRTVVIVSHRLSSLVSCNAIVVLDRGRIVDVAPHNILLERCELYRHLWSQQNRAA